MNQPTTIQVRNKLPFLLEAVCLHEECPDWLRNAIWDAVADQSQAVIYTATHWESQFESIHFHDNRSDESGPAIVYGGNVVPMFAGGQR